MALWRIRTHGGIRLARGPVADGPQELFSPEVTIDGLLGGRPDRIENSFGAPSAGPVPPDAQILAPIEGQEVWAAGVTYRRSRDARAIESTTPEFYERVYGADRPELFFKCAAGKVRGPGEPIGIRADSTWNVPEPELGLVCAADGTVVAYTIGNDVTSRSIEGENPLYLPQGKIYDGSCALGPCLVPVDEAPAPGTMSISLDVVRDRRAIYTDTVHISEMRRTLDELVGWLYAGQTFPAGVVLLTGTSIVPDDGFTLQAGDLVTIAVPGLGVLENTTELVSTSSRGPMDLDRTRP